MLSLTYVVNTRRKGRRNELKAKAILEAAGYDVQLAPNPSKWSLQNDLWGLWDLCAVDAESIRFVQIKTNARETLIDREKMSLWPCPSWCRKEVWVFYDKKKHPIIHKL